MTTSVYCLYLGVIYSKVCTMLVSGGLWYMSTASLAICPCTAHHHSVVWFMWGNSRLCFILFMSQTLDTLICRLFLEFHSLHISLCVDRFRIYIACQIRPKLGAKMFWNPIRKSRFFICDQSDRPLCRICIWHHWYKNDLYILFGLKISLIG